MRRFLLIAAALSLGALPALAGTIIDLPRLDFPPAVTTSASNGK